MQAREHSQVVPLRRAFRAAEFFAGIGLVRLSLEWTGGEVVFANDIEPTKRALYAANFGGDEFRLGDVRDVHGSDLPDVDVATASFPCTDLSLAGNRAGLAGAQSGMFWELARVLREMGDRRPKIALLENVPSFATSHEGSDLRAAITELGDLGYSCDLLALNASHFVPQSRLRLFVVAVKDPVVAPCGGEQSELRPPWLTRFRDENPDLSFWTAPIDPPSATAGTLDEVVERLRPTDARWWNQDRVGRFCASLSDIQATRLAGLRKGRKLQWGTAYRRTRHGRAVWEIRPDEISGCLRTARGGSSKQVLVQAGRDTLRIRWMTPREYARLQGVPDAFTLDAVTPNQALFGLGDAVCVPAVAWVIKEAVLPLLTADGEPRAMAASA